MEEKSGLIHVVLIEHFDHYAPFPLCNTKARTRTQNSNHHAIELLHTMLEVDLCYLIVKLERVVMKTMGTEMKELGGH